MKGHLLLKEEESSQEIGTFYSDPSAKVVICFLNEDPRIENFENDLAEQIVSKATQKVVILQSAPLASLKTSAEITSSTVARSLKSSSFGAATKIKALERPNVVSGVSAAGEFPKTERIPKNNLLSLLVLTACEFAKKPGMLLMNFTESFEQDSMTLGGFLGIFHQPELSQFRENFSIDRLKALSTGETGNLYV